jgi:hypothetical protein
VVYMPNSRPSSRSPDVSKSTVRAASTVCFQRAPTHNAQLMNHERRAVGEAVIAD